MEENKWNKTNQWENELEQLHAIIRKTPLVETTKWGGPVYTYNNKNVVGIGGFKSYFGIWFYNGVFLKDEKKLLINANEENTKSLRQMRFNSGNEIDEKLILGYIKEAIEIEEKGLIIPKEKKETAKKDSKVKKTKEKPAPEKKAKDKKKKKASKEED